jgi:protein TonB
MPLPLPRRHTATLAILAIATFVGACSKGEPESSKPRPNTGQVSTLTTESTPKPEVASGPEGAPPAVDANAGLKEQLARQDAAAKMLGSAKPETPPPPPPEPVKLREPPRAPPLAQAAPPKAVRAEPLKVAVAEPAQAEVVTPQFARNEAPIAQPPIAQPPPAPPPRIEVAAVKAAAVSVSAAALLVTRVDPDFPREAIQAGIEKGSVKARMTLDAGGSVTKVEVIEAIPRRIFDRAVTRALAQWHYNAGAAGRTVDVEVEFRR